jgi:hypothetical protein
LAWILCGYAEQLEFLDTLPVTLFEPYGGKAKVISRYLDVCEAVADFYIENTPEDGMPYWDTGAPGLKKLGDYLSRPADPFNDYEPVDSSAAVIAAQGFIRLGSYLQKHHNPVQGARYLHTGLTIAKSAFSEPYLSTNPEHEGLILHSVYHRPNGWDHVPDDKKVPSGEATMWGDYHARELAVQILRQALDKTPYQFFDLSFNP